MIKISNLAKNIQVFFAAAAIAQYNDKYTFRILSDTADYKQPTREANEVTTYIHGILTQLNSDIETTAINTFNGVLEARLELLAPITDEEDEEGNFALLNDVRNVIDTAFSSNDVGEMIDDDDFSYSYGVKYSIASTGERKQGFYIGDCMSFVVYLTYVFIEGGVNSRSKRLIIDGNSVAFTKLGFSRRSELEGNVNSGRANGSATNTAAATVFTINFDMPIRDDEINTILSAYVLDGDKSAHTVKIIEIYSSGYNEKTYSMCFAEVGQNFDTALNGAGSVTMVEANTANVA